MKKIEAPFQAGKLLKDLPIRQKLVLSFLCLIIFPVTMIGFFSFYTSSGLINHNTEQYTMDILMETGENINVKLREVERLSFQIISSSQIQDALKISNKGIEDEYEKIDVERTIDNQLKGFLSPDMEVAAIQIISLSGVEYYVNPGSMSFHVNEADKAILNSGRGSAYWFDTDPSTQTIAMGRVINKLSDQERLGYVFIYLRESSIYNVYRKTGIFKNGEFLIINKAGGIISYKDKSMLDSGLEAVAPGLTPDGLRDGFDTAIVNGKRYFTVVRTISPNSWKIVSLIPTAEYERDIVNLKNWILFICISCCLLALLIAVGISGSITRPLRRLSAMMEKVGKGDFNVSLSYESKDEIGTLSSYFDRMVVQVQRLIQEVYQEQYLKQKAELKSLRMQINPHFLYNTLESINWMSRIKGTPEIGDMVKALGDLMRVSIGGDDFISVDEEMRNINNYLMIQKFRYGDRFQVVTDISGDILAVKIPKLILQPIVENAIVHGLEEKVGNGKIVISGAREGGKVLIRVDDDGVGMNEAQAASILVDEEKDRQPDGHAHIGLINVDRRVKLYYGNEYGISVTSVPGQGTSVKISLPVQN
jgi:two-component system sensor histidine kinase YesM